MSQLLKPISASSPSKTRSALSQHTQSKSPHYNEAQQGSTLQKSQQSLRNSHYTSKFEKSIDMDMKQSNSFINPEFEIKKLMNLVELQQHEINNWKRRYEQAEQRVSYQCLSNNTAQAMKDYENHLDQLTNELKNYKSINDDLINKMKEKDSQIEKLNKQQDIYKQQLNDYQSELKYAQKEKVNLDQDASKQLYQQDQRYNKNLKEIQQTHFEQMQIMDDQVQKLQDELMRRNQVIEFQKQEIMQLDSIINEIKTGEKTLIQSLDTYKLKYQDLEVEKRKEINKQNQTFEQTIKQQEKEFLDEKECLIHKISQLQYEIATLNQQHQESQNLISGLQDEIQSQVEQNCYLQEQHQNSTQDLELKYKKIIQELKIDYEQQKIKLSQENSKLNSQLEITSQQLSEYQELNQELQNTLDTLNQHNQTQSEQLNRLQNEFEQLQSQYENDITEQNYEIQQLNDQIEQLTELLEQRSNELDDNRQLRGELALKNNENHLLIQRLQNELESLKQKLIDLQKQHQIQGQVKQEISKSQFEQMKRQMESKIELLETENKTILYKFEMKSRECEEWKLQHNKNL
ncbi:unnamed protein product (macronuclear) [Paramecium tetraurelia]|uniref:Uncharacterized protein n=1 Tax=Paramecium tetraurelia TaxID=5888 RepID=A0E359_PARTE|nr:uncharacterized protein GSPATT00022899001 [Paramecium tetraurelia]CAK89726.1 unnamed protein product [Paramecium tetraurelia]|eukprot:XP_001457123.1 hypothetical protein (macronuclear) [Paramecium tetraurelia strain d4-2]